MGLASRALEVARSEGLAALAVRAAGRVVGGLENATGAVSLALLPYAAVRYRSVRGYREAVERVFGGDPAFALIRPMQVREEIEGLLAILEGVRPRVVLEIGTARGGTLFLWTRVASSDALIISIDLPGGAFGGGYPRARSLLYRRFALDAQRIILLRADSHREETLEAVKGILGGAGVDFLFIDGDHTYQGVKKDFEMYHPLVEDGGIIAFHDIVPGPSHMVGGVPRFWAELKKSLPRDCYTEIVKDWRQGGYGIGLVRAGCQRR